MLEPGFEPATFFCYFNHNVLTARPCHFICVVLIFVISLFPYCILQLYFKLGAVGGRQTHRKNGSVGVALAQTARCNTDEGSVRWCDMEFLSQSQRSVLTFLQFLYSPCLHSYASTFVHTLKIPNSVNHAIVRHQTQILVIVQLKIVSMHSEKPICAPPHLLKVSPVLPLKQFQCSSD